MAPLKLLVAPGCRPTLGQLVMLRFAEDAGLAVDVVADERVHAYCPTFAGQSHIVTEDGTVIFGNPSVVRYLARRIAAQPRGAQLYGAADLAVQTEVDQWIEYAQRTICHSSPTPAAGAAPAAKPQNLPHMQFPTHIVLPEAAPAAACLPGGDHQSTPAICAYMDHVLTTRTFFAGHAFNIADLCLWCSLRALGEEALAPQLKQHVNLRRWYNYVATLPQIKGGIAHLPGGKAAAPAGAPAAAAGEAAGEAAGGEPAKKRLLQVKDAIPGQVVTRFPPEPSGYLHIGHIKAALLNYLVSREYQGRMLFRLDDTNPTKEKDEFVENILADLGRLGIKPDAHSHTSDHFPLIMQMCEKLIKEGKAYADKTPVEQMRKERGDGIASKYRDQPAEESLRLFEEMKKGSEEGLLCVIRAKIDMQNKNKALRDPTLYRCVVDTPHLRTGFTYKVYPTYDFACPIVDSVEGVTHPLRTSEFNDRNDQYYWIIDALGLRKPHIVDFSRLNFNYTLLSKRKLQWFVDKGLVEGWNDPRFPTVQGMLRRGMQIKALEEFLVSQGFSRSTNLQEWDKIWTINKRVIDPVSPRYTAIEAATRVPLHLAGAPEHPVGKSVPRHKKQLELGQKIVMCSNRILIEQADAAMIADGEEVTLMDWGNAIIRRVVRDEKGVVVSAEGDLHLEGDFKKTEKKLTWLADAPDLVRCSLIEFDHLITKKALEEEDNFLDFLNPTTRVETVALGDSSLRNLKQGDVLQLERRGYFVCDRPMMRDTDTLVLFFIPDGRAKAASVLGSKIDARR